PCRRTTKRTQKTRTGPARKKCELSSLCLHQLQRADAFDPVSAAVLHEFLQLDFVFVDSRDHAEIQSHVVALLYPEKVRAGLDEAEGFLVLAERPDHAQRLERERFEGLLW